jgi:dTDP-4-dehydrorhamnose 3,5-epimerase
VGVAGGRRGRSKPSAQAGEAVLIPPLVAHGFFALEALQLAYLVTVEYDGSDEHGFAWDDSEAAIPWPTRAPILSDRDRRNPRLAEALLAARASSGRPHDRQSSTR